MIDDKVYYRENDQMISDDRIEGKKAERIKALVGLREDTVQMLQVQLREDVPDEEIKRMQQSLSEKYDRFHINSGLSIVEQIQQHSSRIQTFLWYPVWRLWKKMGKPRRRIFLQSVPSCHTERLSIAKPHRRLTLSA